MLYKKILIVLLKHTFLYLRYFIIIILLFVSMCAEKINLLLKRMSVFKYYINICWKGQINH